MQDKEKIAFFDFCGTIVPFQSAGAYMEYVVDSYAGPFRRMRLSFLRAARSLHLFGLYARLSGHRINDKLLMLKLLKGLDYKTLDKAAGSFYNEMIKPGLIPEVMEELRARQRDGFRIVLVSGAFGIYLKYFAKDFNIKDIVSSELLFSNGIFTGKLSGPDCMGENKVKELENRFVRKELFCVAYSDGRSDTPLLKWADEGYVVIRRASWINSNSFKELYWNENAS